MPPPAQAPPRPLPPPIEGPDVVLYRDRALLIISERPRPGTPQAVFRVPVRNCTAAALSVEPGLAGQELLRLDLTARWGRDALVELPMWFPERHRIFLQRLVDEVTAVGHHGSAPPRPPAPPSAPVLAPLPVRRAPRDENWVTFRSGDDDEVVVFDAGQS
ncbi:hypothetical protein CU254_00285 [Amycolatopsis sp. AA4]|nr:hypothetical protein CU254_00285 [Amycolatopsis sp. AA4]EFL04381.1 hypothetical protein SSMG_00052 [Streptomyces sp. AA4]